MRAAQQFSSEIESLDFEVSRVKCELFGSLGHTGKGHGSDTAVLLGLEGNFPESIDPDEIPAILSRIKKTSSLSLNGTHSIKFKGSTDIVFHRRKSLPTHPNGMQFTAFDQHQEIQLQRTYYSVGGGFVINENKDADDLIVEDDTPVRFPFKSAADLLKHCERNQLPISQIILQNELSWNTEAEIRAKLLKIWDAMEDSIQRGCEKGGVLPGGLKVPRRARSIYHKLIAEGHLHNDPLYVMDWVDLYALAVNEENAAGGRVVTAPTNGAAGIIPAVLKYYNKFKSDDCKEQIIKFLLTAGAIAILYKENASISGAEVGCQGEVGVACSMAAGALTEVMGGSPLQVENAAEIGMEHNLGLTCDPIGGLVQIPCIERNAMASVKAINAARLALRGDGGHQVSLDKVIKTMKQTGADMQSKYKETARGGLAVNIIEC
jgi:L-serine dehydratase